MPAATSPALRTDLPLLEYRRLFKTLPPLARESFEGRFAGFLAGPAVAKRAFEQMLKLGGLGGWAGKEFHDGDGMNVCVRNGQEIRTGHMKILGTVKSAIDGQITLALTYYEPPLSYITDELRAYDADTILGMTYLNAGPLKAAAVPFVLRRATR